MSQTDVYKPTALFGAPVVRLTYRGTRFRMPVNEFAIPRMDPNKHRLIQSLEEARDWERLFIGEIDLRWHDLRHEGACRLLADGVEVVSARASVTNRSQRRPGRLEHVVAGGGFEPPTFGL